MRRAVVVVGFLLAACSPSAGPAVGASTAARQSAMPPATASAGEIVAVSQLPLTTVDFTCRLAVARATSSGDLTGGFIAFPAASFTADPNGLVHRTASGTYANDASVALYGVTGMTYDLAAHRWVPTDPKLMRPDGRFYAYATGDYVHVVNVADATEKDFRVSVPGVDTSSVAVAEFDSAGVYLLANRTDQYPSGVWVMNQTTGDVRALAQVSGAMAVRGGYVWIGAVDPRDPSPPRLSSGNLTYDSIVRVDLATGNRTPWFYRPGESVSLLGLDGHGQPVVGLASNSRMDFNSVTEVRLVPRPGEQGALIFSGGWGLQGPQADGDRLWFGGGTGIYLYTAQHGLQNVFAGDGLPVGHCL